MKKSKIDSIKKSINFYKLDFGIDDTVKTDQIFLLTFLATLSGFSAIDVQAKEGNIKIAIEAMTKAKQKSKELNIELKPNPLLCSSLGIKLITNLDDQRIYEKIGYLKDIDIDIIDLHFNENDFLSNMKKIDFICNLFKEKIISVNLSRKRLSNIHMIDLLEKCFSYSKKNLVIEVEGMRFYEQNYSHILQTVSTADIINKQFIQKSPKYKSIPIIFGNCINRDMENLAFKCNVPFKGISIDYQYINNFLNNSSAFCDDEEIKRVLRRINLNFF